MPCSPANIMRLLYPKFGISDATAVISEAETALANKIEQMLRRHAQEDIAMVDVAVDAVRRSKKLKNDERDKDYNPEEDDKVKSFTQITLPEPTKANPELIDFGGRWISREVVEQAIAFYRAPKKRSRSVETMNHRFKWIKGSHHIQKLLKFEKKGVITPTKRVQLVNVQDELHKRIQNSIASGHTPTTLEMRQMARDIAEENGVQNFDASGLWIVKFKRKYNYPVRIVPKAGEGKWPRKKKKAKKVNAQQQEAQADENGALLENGDEAEASVSSIKRRKLVLPRKNIASLPVGQNQDRALQNPNDITLHNMDTSQQHQLGVPQHRQHLHQSNQPGPSHAVVHAQQQQINAHADSGQYIPQQQNDDSIQSQFNNNYGQIIDNNGHVLYYMNNQSNGIFPIHH